MFTYANPPASPQDLGGHCWQVEQDFYHGFINGIYYRMVISAKELEAFRQELAAEDEQENEPVQVRSLDDLWWLLDELHDPDHSHFGPFEPGSPFEEDLDFDSRRRLVAMKMYADPTTTTWYGLSNIYEELICLPKKARQKMLQQRLRNMGIDPLQVSNPEVQRRWTLALEYGLNPFQATEEDIAQCQLVLHKVTIPETLETRINHSSVQTVPFPVLVRIALNFYLTQLEK